MYHDMSSDPIDFKAAEMGSSLYLSIVPVAVCSEALSILLSEAVRGWQIEQGSRQSMSPRTAFNQKGNESE